MEPVEIGELVNLAVDILLLPAVAIVLYRGRMPGARLVLAGTVCLALGHAATIVEGYAFPALFDGIEHASLLAAGCLFLAFIARRFPRPSGGRR